jgi:hypothetical protein
MFFTVNVQFFDVFNSLGKSLLHQNFNLFFKFNKDSLYPLIIQQLLISYPWEDLSLDVHLAVYI